LNLQFAEFADLFWLEWITSSSKWVQQTFTTDYNVTGCVVTFDSEPRLTWRPDSARRPSGLRRTPTLIRTGTNKVTWEADLIPARGWNGSAWQRRVVDTVPARDFLRELTRKADDEVAWWEQFERRLPNLAVGLATVSEAVRLNALDAFLAALWRAMRRVFQPSPGLPATPVADLPDPPPPEDRPPIGWPPACSGSGTGSGPPAVSTPS
jgi:hypothetical protein